jgi:hypothetical protein
VSNLVCPHKKWNIDNHNVGTCANPECGEVRQFPLNEGEEVVVLKKSKLEEKHMVNPKERHLYYEKNKEAILADVKNLGEPATRKKWGIPRGATLPNLLKRWQGSRPHVAPRDDHTLPAFPEFSNNWEASVQVTWLQIYGKLLDRHSSENI